MRRFSPFSGLRLNLAQNTSPNARQVGLQDGHGKVGDIIVPIAKAEKRYLDNETRWSASPCCEISGPPSSCRIETRKHPGQQDPGHSADAGCDGSVVLLESLVVLERVAVGLAGPYPQRMINRRHEDLAVADLPGARARGDDVDRLVGDFG